MRQYKVLKKQVFESGDYKLVPIRHEDRYKIMQWRNEQIDILRQSKPLTTEEQDSYFKNVVFKLFKEERPNQMLFSLLRKQVLIGYCGLVHIDWENDHSEMSFLLKPSLNQGEEYQEITQIVVKQLEDIAAEAGLNKVYTVGYDLYQYRFEPLIGSGYVLEAKLHKHVRINGEYYDVLMYGKLLK